MVALKQQRPIFGFLWPRSRPVPVDGAAVQARWVRIPARGPWRWALLITCTALVITLGAAMISTLLAAPSIMGLLLSLTLLVIAVALLVRAWVVGTSVSDAGIKVSTMRTTVVLPWNVVHDVSVVEGSRVLGLPIRMRGRTLSLTTSNGLVTTHIASASPDLCARPEAFDIAVSGVNTWWRETR